MAARAPKEGRPWEPGLWKRMPWKAACAILGFVVACGVMALVIALSEGQETDRWPTAATPVSVASILSLLLGVANLLLSVAAGEAYAVAWWLKALRGAKLKQLQYDLEVPGNLLAAAERWRLFDGFAATALVALAVSLSTGPVIQKASDKVGRTIGPSDVSVDVAVLGASLPADFSGWAGSGARNSLLMPAFVDVYKAYSNRSSISLPYRGCSNGTCAFNVPGPGFDVNCVESSVPYDFASLTAADPNPITTLQINVTFDAAQTVGSMSAMNVSVLYKPDAACAGSLIRHACVLRAASVSYPVTVANGSAALAPWDVSRNETVSITSFDDWQQLGSGSVGAGGFLTMFGGIASVLQSQYQSNTSLRLADNSNIPFLVAASGQAASTFLTSDFSTYGNCTMTWSDPRPDMVNNVRELMFRSAIAAATAGAPPPALRAVPARETRVAVVYRNSFQFLGIAVACMVVQVAFILHLLWGWRRLGRDVSLDPFELGKALGAPLLRPGPSNSGADEILEAVGERRVRYGEVLDPHGAVALAVFEAGEGGAEKQQRRRRHPGESEPPDRKQGGLVVESHEQDPMLGRLSAQSLEAATRPRLGLEELDRVQDVRAGACY